MGLCQERPHLIEVELEELEAGRFYWSGVVSPITEKGFGFVDGKMQGMISIGIILTTLQVGHPEPYNYRQIVSYFHPTYRS